jgi:cytochrome c oxidase subunit 2
MTSKFRLINFLSTSVLLASVGIFLASCSSSNSSSSIALSAEAKAGQELASASGCASCHGSNGEGRVGPKWAGLADSQVTMSDGTTVTADDAYLYTSIHEPSAMRRKGAVGQMPSNQLTDEEIASIIVYIRALK